MLYREIISFCSEIHTKHINTLCGQNVEFSAKIAKFARSAHKLCHVRPSVRMEQLSSHWTDFLCNPIFEYFSQICRENSSVYKI